MVVSLVLAALVAGMVGVSTFVVVRLQRQELAHSKKEFEEYKLEAERHVADAKKEGIEAGRTASDALLRAAQLEKEAADVRLESEKLKAVVEWRTLSDSQAKALLAQLSIKPGALNLRWTNGDPEAFFLASQIAKILEQAKWNFAPGAALLSNQLIVGVSIPPSENPDADSLRNAFAAAHIEYSKEVPRFAAMFNVSIIPNAPVLMIGSRPQVFPNTDPETKSSHRIAR